MKYLLLAVVFVGDPATIQPVEVNEVYGTALECTQARENLVDRISKSETPNVVAWCSLIK